MNMPELERKLIAVARRNPPSERVPFAFEKRIIAHLMTSPRLDSWTLWGRAMWRAAVSCLGIMLLLSTWALFTGNANAPAIGSNGNSDDLSAEFENTVLAAANQEQLADSN
jgi:hypothetical protein